MITRRKILEASALLAGATASRAAAAASIERREAGDRLWYRQPAAEWTEALPVGNGRIGAMVFGGVGEERLQLNEDTLWSGGPYDPVNPQAKHALPDVRRLIAAGRFADAERLANERVMARPLQQMSYQTFGDLLISMPSENAAGDYRRVLDLDAAIATTRFVLGGVGHERRVVASPARQVIAVHVATDRPGALNLVVRLRPAQDATVSVSGDTLVVSGSNRAEHGVPGALRVAARARVSQKGGRITAEGDALRIDGADEVTILVAMATSYRAFGDTGGDPDAIVRGQIGNAAALSFEALCAEATEEHRRLYRRVRMDLGRTPAALLPTDERIRQGGQVADPAFAALYFQYARYLLIASSRPGSQSANLQGIWNDSTTPPWGSKYTININTEMNYWPAEIAALPECVDPLVALVRDLAETGARTAREMYGARGWVAHHNTDLWRATAPIDGAQWGLWPLGGAWLCTHLWQRWDYGRDEAFLRSVYPLMHGAALFFVDTLQTDPKTGALVTSPSLSPENAHPGGASLCAGPAMDMQILRDLFHQTATAADILGTDADFSAELRAVRKRLAPDKIGALGQLQEWQEDWDATAPEPRHRHVSHLYGLYPSQQIDFDETPALARAARRSLELRGDESTGWATAWRANLWARLRDGEHAHAILRFLFGAERTYPNMFDAHPPFQIDGNFGGAAAIAEMLVQSRGEQILLLPALPRDWPAGSVEGLRVRGACRIDLSWHGGVPRSVTLTSAIAGTRTVRYAGREVRVELAPGKPVRVDPRKLIA